MNSVPHRLAIALFLACGPPQTAAAQDTPSVPAAPPAHRQQISANPFGLLLGLFNAEFERKVSESATLGVGGSFFDDDDGDDYVNGDVFFRFYPSGHPLDGWAFGVKAGATNPPPISVSGSTPTGAGCWGRTTISMSASGSGSNGSSARTTMTSISSRHFGS
jgi:hypothetical protein